MQKNLLYFIVLIFLTSCNSLQRIDSWIATAPAGDRFVTIDKSGETIIPNGRIIAPAGKSIVVAPHPYGLTLSPDVDIPVMLTLLDGLISKNEGI